MAGYPDNPKKFDKLWPADVHVIGKDILRFHAIYWPSFLMAAGLELPKRILCHGHWLVDNKKMSKSIGNVVDPSLCIQKYTKDGLRYFLLREGVPATDTNITEEKFTKFANVELANTLGNLYQRCVPFNKSLKYSSYVEIEYFLTPEDNVFLSKLDQLRHECNHDFEVFDFYKGIQSIMSVLRMCNTLVQEHKPWLLVKSNEQHDLNLLEKMLFIVYETLRVCGILLQPITPNLACDLLDRLNTNENERQFRSAVVEKSDQKSRSINFNPNVLFKRL